jgi:hypothetical protein
VPLMGGNDADRLINCNCSLGWVGLGIAFFSTSGVAGPRKLLGLQTLGCGGQVRSVGPWQYDQCVVHWRGAFRLTKHGMGWVDVCINCVFCAGEAHGVG